MAGTVAIAIGAGVSGENKSVKLDEWLVAQVGLRGKSPWQQSLMG